MDTSKSTEKKLFKAQSQKYYYLDREKITKEYQHAWAIAGTRLQKMFNELHDVRLNPHRGFLWLRTDIITPSFDSMNFSYKNKVFSVLIDFIDENGDSMISDNKKNIQLEVAENNNLIPCLFKIHIDNMQPLSEDWNLVDARSGEAIIPQEMGSDEPTPKSKWEMNSWGISVARKALVNEKYKILSYTDAPGMTPQIWFENIVGEKCWALVQVTVNGIVLETMDPVALAKQIGSDFRGYTSQVEFAAVDSTELIYRNGPAALSYGGLQEIRINDD